MKTEQEDPKNDDDELVSFSDAHETIPHVEPLERRERKELIFVAADKSPPCTLMELPAAVKNDWYPAETTGANRSTLTETRPTRAQVNTVSPRLSPQQRIAIEPPSKPIHADQEELHWLGLDIEFPGSFNSIDPPVSSHCSNDYKRIIYKLEQENFALEQETAYLRGEMDKISNSNRLCSQELDFARQESATLQAELSRIKEKQQLLFTLQGSVADRTSQTTTNGFPAGDEIVTKCLEFGEDCLFLLKDLARTYTNNEVNVAGLNHSRAVKHVQSMLTKYFVDAKSEAAAIVAERKTQCEALVGHSINENEIEPSNTLEGLMWQSIMQVYVKTLFENGLNGHFQVLRNQENEHWTASQSVNMFDDGDLRPTSVLGFCKTMLYLDLVCRFSQPECFLIPNIGTTEPFDGKYHKQIYLGLDGETRAKEGEAVTVLFPGLYFVRDGTEKPKVRAFVAKIN